MIFPFLSGNMGFFFPLEKVKNHDICDNSFFSRFVQASGVDGCCVDFWGGSGSDKSLPILLG